ncbi:RNA methyltransferase [Bacteroidetes bacterium UKL13-3]|jgi:23S rRNA (uracil1939-C5)-methyltransferase|nr:RNA methyltransferase [Bacteroidetes bacterium UKL13-3]HCP93614.1 23S rRNA (uracil(1939)-C(5))-methyltransferase RlmD [Bacteroidota bacterium]
MRKSKFKQYVLTNIPITNAGSEGKSIARQDEKVVLVDYAVPGDIVDLRVISSRKKVNFGKVEKIITSSPDRVEPFCSHFGICGGCKWQQMSYTAQLRYKNQQVLDAFERIGKFPFLPFLPILGSAKTQGYRNKLEYSFTDRKWLTEVSDKEQMTESEHKGLGFHVPGRFDKVLDIEHCYHQPDPSNQIRLAVRDFAIKAGHTFHNAHSQDGFMRNIIIRNASTGEWMVVVVFKENDQEKIQPLMLHLQQQFPQITSLLYVINGKMNDTIHDLPVHVFAGKDHLVERLGNTQFHIGAKSFFQTNTDQTINLYNVARDFAGLTGSENVYDLYTGVGTIALYVAEKAKQVVGIEYVEQAIVDAKHNANLNQNTNTHFYAGDMKDMLNDELIAKHGKPDVVITDPPRAGMDEKVIQKLMEVAPQKIVYVSCNPATQARDIALMQELYEVTKVQPVDMFPHTHHVENVALLELRVSS